MVQGVTHTDAEIQLVYSLLQDMESSMNNSKQQQEEVFICGCLSISNLVIYFITFVSHMFL